MLSVTSPVLVARQLASPSSPAMDGDDQHALTAACGQVPTTMVPELCGLWRRRQQRHDRGQASDRLSGQIQALLARAAQLRADAVEPQWTLNHPAELPVSAQREGVLRALQQRGLLVLTGETGSGKTTQLPKMLIAAGYGQRGRIAITQPRRLAAVSVAARLREECAIAADAATICHAVRFDDRSNDDSRVVVQTDGLLLAEFARDPWLRRYDAIMVDEAHERSTTIDVLLALLIRLRRRRPDLALVVTSATIDGSRFAEHLGDGGPAAPLLEVSGRLYPVTRREYQRTAEDMGYLAALVACVLEIHGSDEEGDILCFLPTERDIIEAQRRLRDCVGATVLPCFGRLTASEQQRIFATCRGRKVVLATPIAETSLTIPGITVVIDSGLARIKRYHAQGRTERLPVEPVSQASLNQRAGRAGRLRPGMCYQLFSAADAAARPLYTEPEIRRSNLAGVLIQLLAAGHRQPEDLPWLDPPGPADWAQARRQLEELGAIAEDGGLTLLGRRLAQIPLDPQLARMCLAGYDEGVPQQMLTIAAFLSIQDPRLRPLGEEAQADAAQRQFHHEAGDVATILKLWSAWQEHTGSSARASFARKHYLSWLRLREWADVRRQIQHSLAGMALPAAAGPASDSMDAVHRSLLSGLLGMVLMRDEEQQCYRGVGNRQLQIHPSSVLRPRREQGRQAQRVPWPPWLVACEIVDTGRPWARLCAPIDPQWIIELAAERIQRRHSTPRWDADRGRVVVEERITWLGLPLVAGRQLAAERVIGRAAAEAVFCAEALAGAQIHPLPAALKDNQAVIAAACTVAIRLRDRSLVIDQDAIAAAYARLVAALPRGPEPRPLTSTAALKRLWREHGPQALALQPQQLVAAWWQAEREWPRTVEIGPGLRVDVQYRHAAGDDDDGATVVIAEADLGRIETWRLERCIPGLVLGQVRTWCERLPAALATTLGSGEGVLYEFTEAVLARTENLDQAIIAVGEERLGPGVPPLRSGSVPAHLRLRVVIVDPARRPLTSTRDLRRLGTSDGDSDPLAALRQQWETEPGRQWPGDIPGPVGSASCKGVVSLRRCRDAQAQVAVQRSLFATAQAAAIWHRDGLLAFVEASLAEAMGEQVTALARELGNGCEGAGADIARGLLLARIDEECDPTIADQAAADALLDRVRQFLSAEEASRRDWARRLAGVHGVIAGYLRRGGRGPDALATLQHSGRLRADLCPPQWWRHYTYAGMLQLPEWLEAIADRINGRLPCSQREQARMDRLLSDWQDWQLEVDYWSARALGHGEEWRQARSSVAECVWAISRGRPPRDGASELAVRSTMATISGSYSTALEAWHRAAAPLRELRPLLDRIGGPLASDLCETIDRSLRRGLDTGLNADVYAQPHYLQSLLQRARSLLS